MDLHKKYGSYNKDGYFITDFDLWDYYAQRPKLYKRKKIKAFAFMILPISGIVVASGIFKEMGLQLF